MDIMTIKMFVYFYLLVGFVIYFLLLCGKEVIMKGVEDNEENDEDAPTVLFLKNNYAYYCIVLSFVWPVVPVIRFFRKGKN